MFPDWTPSTAQDFGDFYTDAPDADLSGGPRSDSLSHGVSSMTPTAMKTRTVRNYDIDSTIGSETKLTVPKGTKLLRTGRQGGKAKVVTSHDSDETETTTRTIKAKGDGDTVNDSDNYLGSMPSDPGYLDSAIAHMFDCGE